MPYLTEHAVRLEPPSKYERFRRENDKFGAGIDAIWGITADDKVELQALRFDAKRYSVEDVRQWLKEHGYEPLEIEPAEQKFSDDAIERDALLMEAGEYPDKGAIITEESLQQMAESGVGAPVIVEHRPTLVLGWIRELWRKGKQLWGKLALKPHANQLIEESAVKGLSVGLRRTPDGGYALHEVSLTTSPRVPNAQLFGLEPPSLYIACDGNPSQVETAMTNDRMTTEMEAIREELEVERARAIKLEAKLLEFAEQLSRAQTQLVRNAVQSIVERYQREGKLTPAAAKHATELLMALATDAPDAIVQFSDDGRAEQLPHAVRSVIGLLDALPVHTTKPAVRMVSLDDATLTERKQELAAALQAKGFSFAANGELPDELVQIAANLKEVQS
jgi:hypothetical protein